MNKLIGPQLTSNELGYPSFDQQKIVLPGLDALIINGDQCTMGVVIRFAIIVICENGNMIHAWSSNRNKLNKDTVVRYNHKILQQAAKGSV